jgi:hypothetical protein
LKSFPKKSTKIPTQTSHHQQLHNDKLPSSFFNSIKFYLSKLITSIRKSSHTSVNNMANLKATPARRKLLAAPTAASQRKGRVSAPPERLIEATPVAAAAKKSRGRRKSNGVSIQSSPSSPSFDRD